MVRAERGFHPLPSTEVKNASGVRITLDLPPFVDQERIGINVRRIQTMMQVGGIRSLHIYDSDSAVSKVNPNVGGFNLDGSLVAVGAHAIEEVPVFETATEHVLFSQSLMHSGQWADAKIKINRSEIMDRMGNDKVNLRSTDRWSTELDDAVRQGISRIGSRYLVLGLDADNRRMFPSPYLYGTSVTVLGEHNDNTENYITNNLGISLAFNILGRIFHHQSGSKDGYRWSLFFGPQIDRAIVLKGLTSAVKTVKEVPAAHTI